MGHWWQEKVVYQIYPRSFCDSNGDGIGDIPGIISKLDYLKNLGIGILWLSPVYCSPNEDNGYDISDYRDINPEYGTMKDMEILIFEAGKRDIRIIMDLVINHTSDQHEWFLKSRDKSSPYRDYYFWREGKNGKLPNNWTSFFAEDAWEYDEESGEYYLHLFAKGQPDLNFHHPKVLEEVKEILRFWLDKGIAGFRCDVINIIWKSSLSDGKKKLVLTGSEHYLSQEGNHEILRTLRKEVFDHYDCFTVGETVFVTPSMGRDLCDEKRKELDMIFSFEHMETDQFFVKWFPRKFSPKRFSRTLSKWQQALSWNANYLENHDQPRSVSRFSNDKEYLEASAKMLATLLLTLRGTPYIYQGQEIGMTNVAFTDIDQITDIESKNLYKMTEKLHIPKGYRWRMIMRGTREHARTPMQWDDSSQAGFTTGKPWIPVNGNYELINMKNQVENSGSVMNFYRTLITLRKENEVLLSGGFRELKISKNVFAYQRELEGTIFTVILNFTKKMVKADFKGQLLLSTYNEKTYHGVLLPYEAVILREEKQ
ncbi:MAG: alpha-glucosidase [Clostridia bacterium]|nr:alpha-glucosidase [Clostridia bacterium]